jgi:hypothetical protein
MGRKHAVSIRKCSRNANRGSGAAWLRSQACAVAASAQFRDSETKTAERHNVAGNQEAAKTNDAWEGHIEGLYSGGRATRLRPLAVLICETI